MSLARASEEIRRDRPSTSSSTASNNQGLPYTTTSELAYSISRPATTERRTTSVTRKSSNPILKRSLSTHSFRSTKPSPSPILTLDALGPNLLPLPYNSPLPSPSPVMSYHEHSPHMSTPSTASSASSPNPFFISSPPFSYSDSSSRPSPISPYPSPLTPVSPLSQGRSPFQVSHQKSASSPIFGSLPFRGRPGKSLEAATNNTSTHSPPLYPSKLREEETSFFQPRSGLSSGFTTAIPAKQDLLNTAVPLAEKKVHNTLRKLSKHWRRIKDKGETTPSDGQGFGGLTPFHTPHASLLSSPSEGAAPSKPLNVHWSAPRPSDCAPETVLTPKMATFPTLPPLMIFKDITTQSSSLSPAPPRKHRAKVSSSSSAGGAALGLDGLSLNDDEDTVEVCADEPESPSQVGKAGWRKMTIFQQHQFQQRKFLDNDEDNDITNNALRLHGLHPARPSPSSSTSSPGAGPPDISFASTLATTGWTTIRSDGRM